MAPLAELLHQGLVGKGLALIKALQALLHQVQSVIDEPRSLFRGHGNGLIYCALATEPGQRKL